MWNEIKFWVWRVIEVIGGTLLFCFVVLMSPFVAVLDFIYDKCSKKITGRKK